MIATGDREVRGRHAAPRRTSRIRSPPGTAGGVGVFVLLRAFASGSAALTGVESISNGVNAFRPPQGKNAAQTLL